MFYVYVIESKSSGILYKGFTADFTKRLHEHNQGLSRYTAGKGPWKLILVKQFDTKKEALQADLKLKLDRPMEFTSKYEFDKNVKKYKGNYKVHKYKGYALS